MKFKRMFALLLLAMGLIVANAAEAVVGDKGPQGPTGKKGPTGDKGPRGDQGATGATGRTGAAGPKGGKGDQGLPGNTGATGATGRTGAAGPKGGKGDQGLPGDKGLQGDKGDAGTNGTNGGKGDQGLPGDKGPQGPIGLTGDTGPAGPQGTIGLTGPEGPVSTVAGPAGTFPDGNVAGDMQYWDGYDWVMVPAPVFTSTTANPPEMATLHFCSNSIAPTWKAACDRIPTPPAIGTCVGLSGQVVGSNIEYTFNGKLNDQFGTLPIGTPFTGKLTYPIQAMNPSVFSPTVRGDYIADSITLTIDGVTVSETGGTINIYDDTYPTDLFAYYTLSAINGTLGGLTISPSSGIQLILQDISKTAWSSVALPGSELTMTNLTSGNATFIQLKSVNNLSGPGMATIARGELCP